MSDEGMMPKKDYSNLYTPIAIVLAGVLIGTGLMFGLRGSSTPADAGQQPPAQAVNIKDVKIVGEPYLGKVDAPVVLAFWSDFQCPFCKAFETGGVPQIPTPAAMPDIVRRAHQIAIRTNGSCGTTIRFTKNKSAYDAVIQPTRPKVSASASRARRVSSRAKWR